MMEVGRVESLEETLCLFALLRIFCITPQSCSTEIVKWSVVLRLQGRRRFTPITNINRYTVQRVHVGSARGLKAVCAVTEQ